VLLAAIVTVAKDGPEYFAFATSVFGLLLTIPWWSSFRYNHALYLLRVAEARALEPQAGSFFTAGSELIDGNSERTSIGLISIPRLARVLSPSRSVQFLIALFFAAFFFLAAKYWPWC
jgi:hypothetical protein